MRKSFTAAEMRHIKECRYCRERVARRRGPAVVKFIESYAHEDTVQSGTIGAKSPHSASEDDRRTRLCTNEKNSHRARADEDDAMKYCPYCGAPMRQDQDEDEEESEGRVIGRNDSNDLGAGQPRYRGRSTPMHSERVGRADEAVKEFRSSYRKARESAQFSADRASAAIVPTGF